MLLVKCEQCGASYKLSEDLYRNKAEGYGVVVTCRRCKAEIHVQNPNTEEGVATTKVESGNEIPTSPVNERPDGAGEPKPEAKSEPKASPPVPRVAPKAPSPAAPPVAAKPPVPKAPAPGGLPPRPAPKPPSPATSKAPPLPKTSGKLVALSPGLLGTVTADKESPKPPPAASQESTADRTPETPASERDTPPGEAPPDSEMPVDSRDFLSAESAPTSEMSVDSSDFIKSSAAQAALEPPKEEPKKKLPTAPAMKKPAAPTKAEAKADEQPSTTGTPKLETLVHGPALGDQKQGETPRRRLASGDLSDDFMSADLGFDVPPALAPPAADALLKAPVSSRPAASKEGTTAKSATSKPADAKAAKSSSKTARPVVIKPESSAGSGRGKMAVLALVVLGGGALLFRDRLGPRTAEPEPPSAAEAPAAAQTPEPPPAEPAPAAAEPAPEPATSAPAEAQPSTPSPPPTGVANPATPTTPATPATPALATQPASTAVAVAPKPAETTAPAPTEPREPRGSAGTEPFDAAAARAALDASAAQASSCRKPGDPSGVAVVMITFAPTGRVTSANISGPPFAATPTGGCIASTLRKTRVPAFAGDMVTVKKTVTIH